MKAYQKFLSLNKKPIQKNFCLVIWSDWAENFSESPCTVFDISQKYVTFYTTSVPY